MASDAGSGPQRSDLAGPPSSALRASDADREQVADILRQAAGDGQITLEELGGRLDATFLARTRGELATLTADLASRPDTTTSVSPAVRGTRWVVSIMGGHERSGRWRIAARCNVINVMGGAELDLTHAELSGPVTTITMVSIMGGGEIRVPDGVEVSVSKLGLMGGNDVRLSETPAPPGSPMIHIRLVSIMGGASVEQGPKRSRAERREQARMQKGSRRDELQ